MYRAQAASIRTDTDRHRQWHRQWMGFSMVVERPNIVEVRRNPCSTESEYLQEITCSALRKWRMMKMTWFQTCRLQTPLFSRSNRTAKRLLFANVDAAACGMRSSASTSTNIYEHLRTSTNTQMLRWTCTPMPWSSLSAAPNYGHVRSCQSMRGTALQWAWLSDCQGALPRNPLRGLAKWIKMDQNGYWHLDMVWYGSDGPDMPRYIMIYSRYI